MIGVYVLFQNEACLTEEDITEKLVERLQYELGTMLGVFLQFVFKIEIRSFKLLWK